MGASTSPIKILLTCVRIGQRCPMRGKKLKRRPANSGAGGAKTSWNLRALACTVKILKAFASACGFGV